MRVVAMSDTHNWVVDDVPDGDLLIHAGDATSLGSLPEAEAFARWFNRLPHRHKVFIPGNHDLLFERAPEIGRQLMAPTQVLNGEHTMIEGRLVWGSSYVPPYCGWAFMESEEQLAERFRAVTAGAIVITHGPPHGILDYAWRGVHAGSTALRAAVLERRPLAHFFGHIHEAHGAEPPFYNVAVCDVWNHRRYASTVVDIGTT